MSGEKIYKVIQWATGNVGTCSLKGIIEHPRMELVGLYVSSPGKLGKDAGDLAGLPTTGIKAVGALAEILALDADCVVYMRQGTDFDEVCAILESGKNIVTTRGDFHHPRTMDPAIRARVEAACVKGGTSIYSTGSSPGFITEAVAIPLLSLSRNLECLTIDEYADMTSRDSPEMIFGVMGYGVPMGAFDQNKVDYIQHDFAGSLGQIADAIGLPFDNVTAVGEQAAALSTKQIAAGTIPEGTVGALRITVTGYNKGKPVLRFRCNWYCTTDIAEQWDLRESGWRVRVDSETPLDVSITYPVSEEYYPLFTPGLTGHRAVNAVPMVCDAVPGIRTTVDMAPVIPIFAR
jgi:4-hydroxy-tetrahydrodipicolinate reductase